VIDSDDISRMLVEIVAKKPHTMTGPEAEAMYAQLEKECDEIRARGLDVDVPYEVPDL